MNADFDIQRIKRMLDRSVAQIDPPTLACLRSARKQALNRYDVRSASLPLFAWADGHIISHTSTNYRWSYYWIGVILLACLYSGTGYWQQTMDNDSSEEDIAILTDDLPIQYFLD